MVRVARELLSSVFRRQEEQESVYHPFSETRSPATVVPSYGSAVRFNPTMAFLLGALFTAFFLMGFLCVYMQRCLITRRRRRAHIQNAILLPELLNSVLGMAPPQGLDKETIQSLPVMKYGDAEAMKAPVKLSTECSVCLTEFNHTDDLKCLPDCGHFFHVECIDMWLSSHSTCPLCRSTIVPRCRCHEGGHVSVGIPEETDAAGAEEERHRYLCRSNSTPVFDPEKDQQQTVPRQQRALQRAVSSCL